MKLKIVLFILCIAAFVAVAGAQVVTVEGKSFSVEATEKSLTKDAKVTSSTITLEGESFKVYKTKATKSWPSGRYFIVAPKKSGGVKRVYLNEN